MYVHEKDKMICGRTCRRKKGKGVASKRLKRGALKFIEEIHSLDIDCVELQSNI
jgi:hypothetical protein